MSGGRGHWLITHNQTCNHWFILWVFPCPVSLHHEGRGSPAVRLAQEPGNTVMSEWCRRNDKTVIPHRDTESLSFFLSFFLSVSFSFIFSFPVRTALLSISLLPSVYSCVWHTAHTLHACNPLAPERLIESAWTLLCTSVLFFMVWSCHCFYLCPFFQPLSHFLWPLSCHSPPVHQMPSDFSFCPPGPDTPICSAITWFPSPERPLPSPHLHLIPSSASHIYRHQPRSPQLPWTLCLCAQARTCT